ncbi:MAG: hypothetical protein QM811_02560 [Pirellulales bacterium]
MLTTVVVALSGLCGLANGAYLATGRGTALPWAGIVLSIAAGALLLLLIWVTPNIEALWKATAVVSIFAIACGHLSLLSIARLATNYAWSMKLAQALIFGVASLLTLLIVGEIAHEGPIRLLAVGAILDAAVTILIPIFHKLSKSDPASAHAAADPTVVEIDREIATLRTRIEELEQRKRERAL